MSPLSGVIASSMVVCQAVHRLDSLLSVLDDLRNAPEDIASLKREVSNIKVALERVQSLATKGAEFEVPRQTIPFTGLSIASPAGLLSCTSFPMLIIPLLHQLNQYIYSLPSSTIK